MEELNTPSPEEKKAFNAYHKQMHRAFEHLGSKVTKTNSKYQNKGLSKLLRTGRK